jgi:hypothetical protein
MASSTGGWSMITSSAVLSISNQDWNLKNPTSPFLFYTTGYPATVDSTIRYTGATAGDQIWDFVPLTALPATSSGTVILTSATNNYLAMVSFQAGVAYESSNPTIIPQGRRVYWSLGKSSSTGEPGDIISGLLPIYYIMESILYSFAAHESLTVSRVHLKIPVSTGSSANNNSFFITSSWPSTQAYNLTVNPPSGMELITTNPITFAASSIQQQVQFRSVSGVATAAANFTFGTITSSDPSLFGKIPSPQVSVEIVSLASFSLGTSVTAGNNLMHPSPLLIHYQKIIQSLTHNRCITIDTKSITNK